MALYHYNDDAIFIFCILEWNFQIDYQNLIFTVFHIFYSFSCRMKFAKELGAHITPEWRKQYIQYERQEKEYLHEYLSLSYYFICFLKDEINA